METQIKTQQPDESLQKQFLHYRDYILVVVVLLISLTGNFWFWQLAQASVVRTANSVFDLTVLNKTEAIRDTVVGGITLLEEGKSLYETIPQLSRKEFNTYFQNEFVTEADKYTGIRGVMRIDFPTKKDEYIASVKNDKSVSNTGFPYFEVFPANAVTEYAVISNIVPITPNKELMGYNLYADPYYATLLQKARDSGEEVVSDKHILLNKPAILVVAPLYDTAKQKSTIEQRRSAILGFVALLVDPEEMDFISKNTEEHYALKIYDRKLEAQELASHEPIYEELEDTTVSGTPLTSIARIPVADREWTIVITTTHQAQITPFQRYLPTALFVAGTVFSLLLFAYISSLLLKDPERSQKEAK